MAKWDLEDYSNQKLKRDYPLLVEKADAMSEKRLGLRLKLGELDLELDNLLSLLRAIEQEAARRKMRL